jgi:hypothetical protein
VISLLKSLYTIGEKVMKRRILMVGLIIALAITLLAACRGDASIDISNLSAEEIVIRSGEVMENVNSFESSVQTETEIRFFDETINMISVMDMVVNVEPMRMRVITSMGDPLDVIEMDTIVYIMQEGDNLVIYFNLPEAGWFKQTQPFSQEFWEHLQIQSPHEAMSSARIIGEETINGTRSWNIEVTMSGEAMYEIMVSMQESITEIIDPTHFAELGDMTLNLWVAQDTFYQIRMVIDMTETLNEQIDLEGVDLTRMVMSMNSFNIGTAPVVTLPEEAADAEDVTF